jgi:uncharacterized protein (DUF1015 family)
MAVPRFSPFAGLRYDPDAVALADVLAPPYDVVDADEQAALEARSPYNAVRLELPREEGGLDRYAAARRRLDEWRDAGVLVPDPEPAFYVYRMGWRTDDGGLRQTTGVIGALELEPPGEGGVLPHERTMPKPKSDRLDLLRACRANLSPVWGLSLTAGLTGLCEPSDPPLARATDDAGVHHRLWRVTRPGTVAAIADAVAASPVVIADGHHRYETALAYQAERRAETDGPGEWDRVMVYVVGLADDQLSVGAIHRVVSGLPPGFDLLGALETWFDAFPAGPSPVTLEEQMADAQALALVLPDARWLLRPRPEALEEAADLDSARLDVARAALPPHDLHYQHGAAAAVAQVEAGPAQAAFLLRPPSVTRIAAAARAAERMPEKTTYFHPKPATGLVFRAL